MAGQQEGYTGLEIVLQKKELLCMAGCWNMESGIVQS